VLTAERLLEPRKDFNYQSMSEQVDGWYWDDIVGQCFPDSSGGNGKGSPTDSLQFER